LKIEVRFPHLRVSQFKSLFGLLVRSPYSFSCLSFGLIVGRTPLDMITSIFGDTDHFGESGDGYLWVPAKLVIDHLADVDHEYDFERLASAFSAVVRRFYGRVSFGFPPASTCGFTAFRAGVYAHYRMIRFELTQPVRPFPLSHPWMDPSALGSLAALFQAAVRDGGAGVSASSAPLATWEAQPDYIQLVPPGAALASARGPRGHVRRPVRMMGYSWMGRTARLALESEFSDHEDSLDEAEESPDDELVPFNEPSVDHIPAARGRGLGRGRRSRPFRR
jgi:hypothetical protein